jgi:hypothetical protein
MSAPTAKSSQARKPSDTGGIGSGALGHNGYYVELASGGPWLTRGYRVTMRFKGRGIWQTPHDAQEAIEKSLRPNEARLSRGRL